MDTTLSELEAEMEQSKCKLHLFEAPILQQLEVPELQDTDSTRGSPATVSLRCSAPIRLQHTAIERTWTALGLHSDNRMFLLAARRLPVADLVRGPS